MTTTPSGSIIILALDAADLRLAERWNCENILLEYHSPIDTYSYSYDVPYTPEVWATVATGKGPDELQVAGKERQHNIPLESLGRKIIKKLPVITQEQTGELLDKLIKNDQSERQLEGTIFEKGLVNQWPGLVSSPNFRSDQNIVKELSESTITENEFWKSVIANLGEEIGWLSCMSMLDYPIVGTHIHTLDSLGHVYSDSEDMLKRGYNMVDQAIGSLRDSPNNIIIMSDHGMQVKWLSDQDPGEHSWHPLISTTFMENSPKSVYEIHDWLCGIVGDKNRSSGPDNNTNIPVDHLKKLGYFQ